MWLVGYPIGRYKDQIHMASKYRKSGFDPGIICLQCHALTISTRWHPLQDVVMFAALPPFS